MITCPGFRNFLRILKIPGRAEKGKCTYVVDEMTVIKLIDDKEAEERYLDALVSSFVEDNPGVKWCPRAGIFQEMAGK